MQFNKADSTLSKNLKQLQGNRFRNIQKLKEWPTIDLKDLKAKLWDGKELSEENNNKLSAMVLYEKYNQVNEAIGVKEGNEVEVWDLLN